MSERAKAHALALVLWLLVVGGALATRPFEADCCGHDAFESLAMGALLLAFAASRRVRSLLGGIGLPRALFVSALLGLALWGQLARDNRVSFPFLAWSMYTKQDPPSEYLDFEVRYRNGETGRFPFGQLASFAGSKFMVPQGRALENRITQWLDPERGALDPETARTELGKLVATYNARHPDNPVVSMTVLRCSVPIRDFAGRESVVREPLLEVGFDD